MAYAQTANLSPNLPSGNPNAQLQAEVAALQTQVNAQQAQISSLQNQLAAVQNNKALALGPYVSVDSGKENGVNGPHIIFSGANIHIVSGSGATDDHRLNGGTPTGLGNLFIGYDELDVNQVPDRGGSHNLVIGRFSQFSSAAFEGLVLGERNAILAEGASVTGGQLNVVNGPFASASGGNGNVVSGSFASVSGGLSNSPTGEVASVSGGYANTASGYAASVSGGDGNVASGTAASILGGAGITVSTQFGHFP